MPKGYVCIRHDKDGDVYLRDDTGTRVFSSKVTAISRAEQDAKQPLQWADGRAARYTVRRIGEGQRYGIN